MIEEPPPPAEIAPPAAEQATPAPAFVPSQNDAGRVVIDLTQLVPPPPADCAIDEPDPFNPEIVVCQTVRVSPRLGPQIGPVDEEFGSAIPRARIKLSDRAAAEANLQNAPVGGFNANGGEVRVKIDF